MRRFNFVLTIFFTMKFIMNDIDHVSVVTEPS